MYINLRQKRPSAFLITIMLALTCIILSACLFSGTAFAKKSKGKSNKKAVVKTVKASYRDGFFNERYSWNVKYSDGFFSGKADSLSVKKMGRIAKLSMLASSTVYSKKLGERFMLSDALGFKKVKYITHKSSTLDCDHSNYLIGYKIIGKTTLIAIWIKGSQGEIKKLAPDWVSNFNIGSGTNHKGFENAENELNAELITYISELKRENKIKKKLKFWITGHSRGAAIANLFGKRMTLKYGKENVFAYTFASPYVSKFGNNINNAYGNIVNFINPGDVVANVPPNRLNYKRFGKDYMLNSRYSEMCRLFRAKTGHIFEGNHTKDVVDDFNESYGERNSFLAYFFGLPGHEIDKVSQAHCQSLYMSWLEALY